MNEYIGTFVCDSCGFRFPLDQKQTIMDEGMESWDVCPTCNNQEATP